MPILPEYSLTGRAAILASAGGDDTPLLALALAEAGANVFVVARRPEKLDDALNVLSDAGRPGAEHGGHRDDAGYSGGGGPSPGNFRPDTPTGGYSGQRQPQPVRQTPG